MYLRKTYSYCPSVTVLKLCLEGPQKCKYLSLQDQLQINASETANNETLEMWNGHQATAASIFSPIKFSVDCCSRATLIVCGRSVFASITYIYVASKLTVLLQNPMVEQDECWCSLDCNHFSIGQLTVLCRNLWWYSLRVVGTMLMGSLCRVDESYLKINPSYQDNS